MSKLTDRQLVELAAKAMDFTWNPKTKSQDIWLHGCFLEDGEQDEYGWCPLVDIEQAFHVACRLGIQMVPYPETKPPMAIAMLPNHIDMDYFGESANMVSMEQAMCRAITRAAAQLQLLKEKRHD